MTNPPEDRFDTTRWSLVLRSRSSSGEEASIALNELYSQYWFPIYGYIRHRVFSAEEAEDLTQGFFHHLLKRGYLDRADPELGRMRSFLLTDLKFYLSNERGRSNAARRKPAEPLLSLDFSEASMKVADQQDGGKTPDEMFDRQWALEVFEVALEKVRSSYFSKGKGELFELIESCLEGTDDGESAVIAGKLGKDTNYVHQQVFRLRKRFRQAFRSTIADTVASTEEVDVEIAYLLESLK